MSRLLLIVLLACTIASAIGVVFMRHRHRQLFVELSKLEHARDELNIEFGRLQLEQATVAESNRIDQVAREVFGVRITRTGSAAQSGATATYENPCYSGPIGLIRYAQLMDAEKPWLSPFAKLGRRMVEMFSSWTM